jgi:uncharacterized protein YcsI (UPF0317 family)
MRRREWSTSTAGIAPGPRSDRPRFAGAAVGRAGNGAPVQIGAPEAIGIADLAVPDWRDPVPIYPGVVRVFWACGVTPQAVATAAKPPLMITHAPGHMFVTDVPIMSLAAC